MKIIETRSAPNPRRVRMFLAEKGLAVPFEEQPLTRDVLHGPAFARVNPMRRVPVLVLDDGTAIAETMAICRYFEEVHPNPPLMGRTPIEKATIEMWQRRVELGLLGCVAAVFRHLHPKMADLEVPQVAAWGEANRPKVVEHLAILESQLAAVPYVAGEALSVADLTLFVTIAFMKPAKLPPPVDFPSVSAWYARMAARPSASA
jgi:glutathione S-transferase